MLTRMLIVVALVLVFGGPVAADTGQRPVDENDFQTLVTLASPAIAPDGQRAVLVVSHVIWDDSRRYKQLVEVRIADGTKRVLISSRAGLSDPAYSPDGSRLAFIADDGTGSDSRSQIFMLPSKGDAAAKAVTQRKTDVQQFAWAPDGRTLVYAAADPEPARAGADRFRDSFLFTTEPIVAHARPAPVHLFLLDLAGGTSTQLTFGPQSVADGSSISWAPDGKTIAFTLSRNAITNDQSYSRIALVDVASKTIRMLTHRMMWEGSPRFSPDGTHVAYTYSDGDPQIALTSLYVTTPAGGAGLPISAAIDRPIGDFVWTANSRNLIVTAPDRTTNALYSLSLDKRFARIPIGDVTPGLPLTTTGSAESPALGVAVANDGRLVFVGSSPQQPPELFAYHSDAGARQVSDFNVAMSRFQWSKVERITFPTTLGVTGDGVLYLPPNFSRHKRYPLVVYIHGGPDDPSMLTFDFWSQVMASRGWLVLRPNYRGSPNLGLKYQRAILYDPEVGPGKDIIAALDAVRARGIVDDSKLAISGWSYGGIMTAWMISKYHIWKAAVSGASVNDWITDYGTADDSLADVDLLHGSPFVGNHAAEWRRISPITYARDVTTPVLILSDIGDNRDPFATSSMYWRALRDNGKDAVLRTWPVEGHFPDDPVRTVDVYHYWLDFIAQHFR